MDAAAWKLIDELITRWNGWHGIAPDYLNRHIPQVVLPTRYDQLLEPERDIVRSLRGLLSKDEWPQLPMMIIQRAENKDAREKAEQAAKEQNRYKSESDYRRATFERQYRLRLAEEQARQQKEHEQRARERQRAEAAELARKQAVIARLQSTFESDFLSVDRARAGDPDAGLLGDSEYQPLKARFVQDWAARTLQLSLDSEQAAAIAATGGDVRVVARAGSGKTRTLVTRAVFLQQHCRISPRELLLLAFNNRAADEMKRRLAKTLGANLPHVMTFHALAHALVGPQKLLIEDRSTDQPGRSREVQKVIDQLVRSADHERLIRAVMLAHFREESEPSADERSDLTMQEYLAYRRALPRESLNGDYVKSSGEKIIANALFEHSIQYEYERPYPWGDGMYRPDFTVFGGSKRNVIIEYFGLKGDADYDEQSRRKQEFWATRREVFLDFSPKHLATRGQDEFVQFLLQKLHALGITYLRRSDDEIWQIIKRKALCQFTMAMQDFIARCRTLNLNPSALHTMVRLHASSSTAEAGFLEIAIPLYEGYLERLAAEKTNDFDGLIWHAASHIRGGSTAFVRDAGRNAATLAS